MVCVRALLDLIISLPNTLHIVFILGRIHCGRHLPDRLHARFVLRRIHAGAFHGLDCKLDRLSLSGRNFNRFVGL